MHTHTFLIESFDDNDEPCTISVSCSTREQAEAIAGNACSLLRMRGVIHGGSSVSEVEEKPVILPAGRPRLTVVK